MGDYPPANSAVLCARASADVDHALVGAIYDTDDDLLPTDPAVAEALRDAVCAQVAAWASAEPATPGPAGRMRVVAPPGERGLCAAAVAPLRLAGLLPVRAVSYG